MRAKVQLTRIVWLVIARAEGGRPRKDDPAPRWTELAGR
jgi:hypothetical protein